MAKIIRYIMIIFCISIFVAFHSGAVEDIKREIRAVWVATNFRLDWPPHTFNQEKQKEELINIFNDINRKIMTFI